jgi:hypothetical protein
MYTVSSMSPIKDSASKRLAILVTALLLSLLLANLRAYYWVEHAKTLWPTEPALSLMARYTSEAHHVRSPDYVSRLHRDAPPTRLLFSEVNGFRERNKHNILLQGDSWAEQAGEGEPLSWLSTISRTRPYGLLAAGTSSYAPSPMTMQLRILRRDFRIFPDTIIAIIDQTDLGDEICRYKDRRVAGNDGTLVKLSPEQSTGEVYDMTSYFQRADNIFSRDWALMKLVNHFRYDVLNDLNGQGHASCRMGRIVGPLKNGATGQEEETFLAAVTGYVEEVFRDPSAKRLLIVTHPHRNHLLPLSDADRYKTNLNGLVRRAVRASKHAGKVTLVDFTERFKDVYGAKADEAEIFQAGDPGSHLTAHAYATKFLPYIFSHL